MILLIRSLSIKTRSALIIGATFLCLIIGMQITFSTLVVRDAETIERDQMKDHVERVVRAIREQASQLAIKNQDWSKWDETYRFIEDRNAQYIEGNLKFETVSALNLSHIVYFTAIGQLAAGFEVDYASKNVKPLSERPLMELGVKASLARLPGPNDSRQGVVRIDDRVFLFATQPILNSVRDKPVKGVLLFTQEITPQFIEAIASQTRLLVAGSAVATLGEFERSLLPEFVDSEPFLFKRLSVDEAKGYSVITDITNKPALLVSVLMQRRVYGQALSTRNLTLLYVLAWGVVATAITMLLLHGIVLAPLERVTAKVKEISESKDTSVRVEFDEKNEIGTLASSMNAMLHALEEANQAIVLARDEADAANQAKTTFIAKVSHELRTPLNGIIGMLRIVLRSELSMVVREQLYTARHAADGLLAIINDILDYAKFQSGDIFIKKGEFSLVHLMRDVLTTVGPKAYERVGVEVSAHLHQAVPERLYGDPLRLKQILVNLLGNSVKFTTEGSIQMVVSLNPQRTAVIYQVIDTGCGIQSSRLKSIFEPFTQADDAPARRYTGTGLGLTIVKQLAEAMGGTVEVESTRGKRTEFRVILPLEKHPSVKSSDEVFPQPSTNERVALLVGEGSLRTFLQAVFADAGIQMRVLQAGSYDPKELELLPEELLLVDGGVLKERVFAKHFELMVQINGPEQMVVLVSPNQDVLKRQIGGANIARIAYKPLLSTDIVRIVRGAEVRALYQEGGFEAAQFLRRSKLRVLVAEDVLLNQTILKDLFEANNIAVKIVDDGQQLIEAVMPTLKARARDENEEEQFDLVLTDIYMPNIDGIEAARMIRIQESSLGVGQYGRVPIVALTANAFRDEHVKMIEAGIDEVVTKPLEPMELWKKIREFQDKRRIPLEEQETESGGEGAAVVGPPMGRALTEAGLRQLADRAVLDVLGTSENDFPLLRQYYAMMVTTRGRLVDEDRIEIYEIATEFWRFDDFARRLGGNGEAVQKSLDMFLGSYPEMFHIIERARAVKNEDGLKRAVHSVGGVLAQLGCTVGWYLAREVESNCYFNDWFRMDMLLRELRQVTEVFVRSVQGYLAYYSRSTGRPERSV